MRVLVTGGSGYLGNHVRRFFDADDFSRRAGHDVLDPEDVKLVANYDAVIHLAAHLDKDPSASDLCFQTNVEGTANVIRNMSPNSVFIYASTKDVYGANADQFQVVPESCPTSYTGQTALEWSKLIGERYLEYYARERNVRACIFRMSTIYARQSDGNESGFVTHYVESVKHGWPLRLPVGGQPSRDILHVDDFARACQAFIDSSQVYGLYNLGGGPKNAVTLRELVNIVGDLIEINPVILDNVNASNPVPLNYVSDLTRIREQLGWDPQIDVREGLRSLL